MLNIRHLTLLLTLSWLIAACSSKPIEIHYYSLYDSPKTNASAELDNIDKRIRIVNLRLADYLQQTGLVMGTEQSELFFSNQHRWAEGLQYSIEKSLLANLNQQSDSSLYLGPKDPDIAKIDYELVIHIEHFFPNSQSQVQASGQYWLKEATGSKVLLKRRFYITESLEQDGYQHSVSKMKVLLARLAKQIHQQI